MNKQDLNTLLAARRLADLCLEDIFTDAPEHRDRVDEACELARVIRDAVPTCTIGLPTGGDYRTIFMIDVDGRNPVEAALECFDIMRDPLGFEPVITTIDRQGNVIDVDLNKPLDDLEKEHGVR
jgi:hypothetical protein